MRCPETYASLAPVFFPGAADTPSSSGGCQPPALPFRLFFLQRTTKDQLPYPQNVRSVLLNHIVFSPNISKPTVFK